MATMLNIEDIAQYIEMVHINSNLTRTHNNIINQNNINSDSNNSNKKIKCNINDLKQKIDKCKRKSNYILVKINNEIDLFNINDFKSFEYFNSALAHTWQEHDMHLRKKLHIRRKSTKNNNNNKNNGNFDDYDMDIIDIGNKIRDFDLIHFKVLVNYVKNGKLPTNGIILSNMNLID